MSTIFGIIAAAIASAVAGVICLKTSRVQQRREAESDVKKEEREIEKRKEAIRKAIYEKDDEAVNGTISSLLMIVAMSCATMIAGCKSNQTPVVYVAADRRIVSMTNEYGVACKAVPDVVFAEMAEKLIELEALKLERKVDKRVGQ